MTDRIYDLFRNIAQDAMERGLDLSLEQKAYKHDSNTMGTLAKGKTRDKGVILRVWHPTVEQEADDVES